jgi:hypothetical protein
MKTQFSVHLYIPIVLVFNALACFNVLIHQKVWSTDKTLLLMKQVVLIENNVWLCRNMQQDAGM